MWPAGPLRIICTVKPTAFRYRTPESVDEALALLAEAGDDAAPLAGGQSLVPMMNLRLVQVGEIVDLNRLTELAAVEAGDGTLRIGALTRQRALERRPGIRDVAPLLAQALPHVAHPPIRARGTVGGSLAHADPAAELSTVMVAADARMVLARRGGERAVPAEEFFLGPYSTVREPDELLVAVELPQPEATDVTAFMELSRKSGDFALVLVAVALRVRAGSCAAARVVVGGAGPRPVRAREAEAVLVGAELADRGRISDAAATAAGELDVTGDVHGSADYRRRVVAVLVRRALEQAALSESREEAA